MVFLLTLGYNVGSAKLPDAIFETVFASNLEFRSDIRIPYEPLGVTTLQHFAALRMSLRSSGAPVTAARYSPTRLYCLSCRKSGLTEDRETEHLRRSVRHFGHIQDRTAFHSLRSSAMEPLEVASPLLASRVTCVRRQRSPNVSQIVLARKLHSWKTELYCRSPRRASCLNLGTRLCSSRSVRS